VVTSSEGRHFCIFDELYSGTNPVEATKSAYAFLMWLSKREYVDFMLTTHYVDICGRWKKVGARITNWKMDAEQDEDGDITYTYRLVRGVSKIQGAIKVLRDMEYPAEIMDTIANYEVVKKGDE
jgi:DNA mismatch repair ATPase MutS